MFDKKFASGTIKNKIMSNQQLPNELHKPITRKYKKYTAYFFFYR